MHDLDERFHLFGVRLHRGVRPHRMARLARAARLDRAGGGGLGGGERGAGGLGAGERGAATAEYAVVIMAAVTFAGALVLIMKSSEVRDALLGLVRSALAG